MKQALTDLYRSWFHPSCLLNNTPHKREEHIDALDIFVRDDEKQHANDWLIANLDTIDRKAQGLLLLGAVVLAIATLLYGNINRDLGGAALVAIVVTMVALIVSCILLATLNVVYWTSTPEFANPSAMLCHLLEIREMRTRIIWLCSIVQIICLASIMVLVVLDASSLP